MNYHTIISEILRYFKIYKNIIKFDKDYNDKNKLQIQQQDNAN